MSPRGRKLIGLFILLPALAAYLLGAAILGALLPPRWYVQAPFYLGAGVLWAFPATFLMRWMEGASKPDAGETRR